MTENDTMKKAVRDLLSRGQATKAEAAKLSGQSRQLVYHWVRDLPDTRSELLNAQWKEALSRAQATTRD